MSRNVRFPPKADITTFDLAPPRGCDENKPNDSKNRTACYPWPLLNHEAGRRPMDDAATLADPKQSHQHSSHAADK